MNTNPNHRPKPKMTKHHRCCKSNKGSNDTSNISIVTEKKHQAWHILFKNLNPEEISQLINSIWLDSKYYFECHKRKPKF